MLLVGVKNDAITLENALTVPQKVKQYSVSYHTHTKKSGKANINILSC